MEIRPGCDERSPVSWILGFSPGSEWAALSLVPTQAGGFLQGQGFPCSKIAFLCPGRTVQFPGNPRSRRFSLYTWTLPGNV